MHHARAGGSGAARFWFRRPVSAGTLLRLQRTGPDDGRSCGWIRKANDDVAVVAEVEGERSTRAGPRATGDRLSEHSLT